MARKIHGTGGAKGHQALEANKQLKRLENRNKLLLRQSLRRRRKHDRNLVNAIKSIAAPEILREWARKEQLIARRQLSRRKIRPFTFYCKLLAMDALFSKKRPVKQIKVGKVKYRPTKNALLDKTTKNDILEKLNEIGASNAKIRKEVAKQMRNLRKILPKTI